MSFEIFYNLLDLLLLVTICLYLLTC